MVRSASVNWSGGFHMAMSARMETSVGIQWLLQPARYFSHTQCYFSGSSWLTSARALIIAFSPTDTLPPDGSMPPSPEALAGPSRRPSASDSAPTGAVRLVVAPDVRVVDQRCSRSRT
jgi:hypothetical protein